MEHQLPKLPYPENALEPYMSRETLEFHHGKHHKTYVHKLNEVIKATQYEDMELESIVRTASGPVFNNAGQAWNHTFFWNCLSPGGGGKPNGRLAEAIDSRFGSFDLFKNKFSTAATELFGSGWAWLVRDTAGLLDIETSSNADTPITGSKQPVLTCDVWEHAYYIDYRNARPEFLDAYWNVVNWKFASRNFEA